MMSAVGSHAVLRFLSVLASVVLLGCGTGKQLPLATPAASSTQPAKAGTVVAGSVGGEAEPAELPEQLVIEAWMDLAVDDVPAAAADIRRQVESAGGRVVSENLGGGATAWKGSLKLRLPPAQMDGLVGWLESRGSVESRRVQGTDVSRTLFDQQIALENLELTLDRLRALLEREDLDMGDVLSIEKEMTRVRGEIEKIKGEKRWLEDRVALATLEVNLRRREGARLGPEAKFYPGGRFGVLTLLDADGRQRNRAGAGMVLHTIAPGGEGFDGRFTLEVDVFEAPADGNRAVLATFGGAAYSDFLGRGDRRFLNPYLGLRLGYGYLDGSAFTVAATAGVELFKHEYFMVDANVRLVGLISGDPEGAAVTGASIVFAF